MINDRDLDAIFDRIAKLTHTEEDIQTLRQSFQALEGQNTFQIGKYIFNIAEGRDIHIGDTTYQGTDAETIRAILREEVKDLLQNQISPKQSDYATWKIEQNKHFSDSLKSSKQSFAAFKQIIDIKSQDVNFIKRQELFARLDNWYSSWNTPHQILTVLGEEGDGKTWGVAYWLEQQIQKSNDFPAVIFLPSNSKIDQEPVDIVSEIVARMVNRSSDICKSSVKSWLVGRASQDENRPTEQYPILLLVLDGINEHHKFSAWLALINALSVSPWQDRVAVLITCRQEYWQSNSPRYLQPEIYNLPAYSEAELTEALQINHLNHSKIPKNLIPLISKPRYFDLMVRYRERIAASGDITVQRLIYEDWRDRFDRKQNAALNDEGFQSLIQELAAKHIEKVKLSELEIVNIIPSIYDKLEIFNEIKSSGIIKRKRDLFEVDKNFLVHGFGLLLVEQLEQAEELGDLDLKEIVAQWLEPHAAMDIKGLICQAASLIALEDADVSLQVKVSLLDAWVSSQNPSEDMEQDFVAYLPLAPEAYIELAEIIWSDAIDNSWAQELLMSAFKRHLDNDRVLVTQSKAFERWLGFLHRFGFDYGGHRSSLSIQNEISELIANNPQNQDELQDFLSGYSPDDIDLTNTRQNQEISDRVGQFLPLGEFSFHGYQLTVIEDDGLLRLGRVALGLISLLPKKDFLRAITIGCLAESVMDSPNKYKLFEWVFTTAREPVWEDLQAEVKQLLNVNNLQFKQAAHRLLSFIGSREADRIKNQLPDNLFPPHQFLEERQKDRCHIFATWTEEDCQICMLRDDLPLHVIAEKIESYCLNPDFRYPSNLGEKLQPLLDGIDNNEIWSSLWQNFSDINYKHYETAFCAADYKRIANKIRSIFQGINNRSRESLRKLCHKIPANYLLFGEIEQELIYKTWEDFNSRSDRSDDIEYTIAESRLFQIVLKGSNAERQLAYLIERSDGNPELLAIENSFADRDGDTLDRLLGSISYTHKQQIQEILQFICQNSQNLSLVMMQELILPKAQLLFDLFKSSSYKQIERILWYISYNSQNLPLKTVRKYVLDYIFHPNEIVRFLAIKTLYHSGLQPVIQDFLDSQWGWSDRHRSFENYWGSILLAKYGGELPYSALAKRVEPDYLGILVRERGLRADEISEFANFIDLAWDEIVLLKIALPNDLPSIEVEAIDSNGGYREPDIELSDRYFSRSLKSIGRLYHWGGIRRSEQLANNNFIDRERQCEGYMNNLSKIANEFVLGHDCSKNPLLFGQIPVDVLSEIVISHPESISKWLEPIAPYQDRAWAQRIVSACSHFYEKLCAALLKRSDKRGIELYNFLSQMERKVKLRDARTNIYFLDTAIFGIPQTASISTDIWQKRLKDCRSDLELMEICIAAQQGNGGEWLKSYAAKNLESDIPLDFAYGSTLLGFLNTNTAKDLLQQQIDLQPVSWRGRSVKLSLERWQHDSWARYWFEAFIHESIPDLAWSRFRLFLQCVDRRYWLWKKELINDVSNQPHSHLSRNLEFLEDNANTIQNSIKTNEKPYQDNFLGQKIEERQAWPLL